MECAVIKIIHFFVSYLGKLNTEYGGGGGGGGLQPLSTIAKTATSTYISALTITQFSKLFFSIYCISKHVQTYSDCVFSLLSQIL